MLKAFPALHRLPIAPSITRYATILNSSHDSTLLLYFCSDFQLEIIMPAQKLNTKEVNKEDKRMHAIFFFWFFFEWVGCCFVAAKWDVCGKNSIYLVLQTSLDGFVPETFLCLCFLPFFDISCYFLFVHLILF